MCNLKKRMFENITIILQITSPKLYWGCTKLGRTSWLKHNVLEANLPPSQMLRCWKERTPNRTITWMYYVNASLLGSALVSSRNYCTLFRSSANEEELKWRISLRWKKEILPLPTIWHNNGLALQQVGHQDKNVENLQKTTLPSNNDYPEGTICMMALPYFLHQIYMCSS